MSEHVRPVSSISRQEHAATLEVFAGIGDVQAWKDDAACRTSDVDFHPGRGDNKGVEAAKAVCATCPVIGECLAYATNNHEKLGVWGGLSENQRRRLRPKREIIHGLNKTYQHRGCRCEPCRNAMSRYRGELRARGVG